jgi:hypothetical protein
MGRKKKRGGERGVGKGRWGDEHCHVKDDCDGGHGCVKGDAWDAGAVGDAWVPLFCDGLAEVDLDQEER